MVVHERGNKVNEVPGARHHTLTRPHITVGNGTICDVNKESLLFRFPTCNEARPTCTEKAAAAASTCENFSLKIRIELVAMVVVGDTEIKIVWADTKTPFPEHHKDGATYIEVEPDADYFVHIKRVSVNFPAPIACCVDIDGQNLGWNIFFKNINRNGCCIGLREKSDQSLCHRCLRFVKPKIRDNVEGKSMGTSPHAYAPLIGKIRVRVYEAHLVKKVVKNNPNITSCTMNPSLTTDHSMAQPQKIAAKLKFVRSSTGSESIPRCESRKTCSWVRLIDEDILNYATMPGLIKAGLFAPVTASVPSSNETCASATVAHDEAVSDQEVPSGKRSAAALVTPPASQESPEESLSSSKRPKKSDAERKLNFSDLTQDD
jgi:hypothetical protein